MRGKLLFWILLLAGIVSCLFACRGKETSFSTCADGHDLREHPLIAATCETDGTAAYLECSRCHKLFDGSGNRVSLADLTLPAACQPDGIWRCDETGHEQTCLVCGKPMLTGKHRFEGGVCSVCGVAQAKTSCQHEGGTATCLERAVCSLCGQAYGRLGAHEKVQIASADFLASKATCTKRASYYESCAVCGFVYTTTFSSGALDPENHRFELDPNGTDEKVHTLVCTLCKEVLVGAHIADQPGSCLDLTHCTKCGQPCRAAEHDFSLAHAIEECLAAPATCQSQATYFRTCADCSAIGGEPFPYGPLGEHQYENGVCKICGAEE